LEKKFNYIETHAKTKWKNGKEKAEEINETLCNRDG